MTVTEIVLWCLPLVGTVGIASLWLVVRRRNMHLWVTSDLRPRSHVPHVDRGAPVDVFLAVCDHFEPEGNSTNASSALQLVQRWQDAYPRLFGEFRDADGNRPQHTFFFPEEEYRPEYLDTLAALCAAGYGDVDVHLHHDRDSADALRHKLESFRDTLYERHGLLRRDPVGGHVTYGFIHGNWALCNSRPDGKWCGVDNELDILRETGCYADFTMPSAPSDTQTRTINSLYYATNCPGESKSHDVGIMARVGQIPPPDSLLMIQGPLGLDWRQRKWGLLPRIENADLHAGRPPTASRMRQWLDANVTVDGRPDWLFVKLHTHGCKAGNIDCLLGEETVAFHHGLQQQVGEDAGFRLHYVTAWEMAQLVHQAEQGRELVDLDTLRAGSSERPLVAESVSAGRV
ncbi:MAG: hypothetical protein ABGZ17_20375 [Planctomycetaceae bacterium]